MAVAETGAAEKLTAFLELESGEDS